MFSIKLEGIEYRCGLWTKLLVTWWQYRGSLVCYIPEEDRPAW